jgi:CxxC motif-containing protein (DUF1111 family)
MARSTSLQRGRRIGAAVSVLLLGSGLIWSFGPGLPVYWGPSASAAAKTEGRNLFLHEWEPNDPLAKGDGLGPVFNARSCVACHFQGGVGGAGPNAFNVTAFEVLPTERDPKVHRGVVHADAVDPDYAETMNVLGWLFPIVPGGTRVIDGCSIRTEDFNPVRTESVNTTPLYGAGWIDRISPRAISHYQLRHTLSNTAQELSLDFNTISPGRVRVLPDGRVGKFGWKAQFATLEEFVAAACANELGLGTSKMAQPKPLSRPSYPDVAPDLDRGQFTALTAYVATLPRPVEAVPEDSSRPISVERGRHLFQNIGCAVCHLPDPGGVPGVYSDFLLHDLEDHGTTPSGYREPVAALPRPSGDPTPSEWKTPPLWGVADSAPYFHDGRSETLRAAILRHGGDAAPARKAFKKLPDADQQAIVDFLGTLRAPPDAEPVPAN